MTEDTDSSEASDKAPTPAVPSTPSSSDDQPAGDPGPLSMELEKRSIDPPGGPRVSDPGPLKMQLLKESDPRTRGHG